MNIAITGMTCSGKTTLANKIKDELKNVSIIHQDDYFKNLDDIPRSYGYYLMDSINAFHVLEFRHDMKMFDSVGNIVVPTYDVSKNKRVCKNTLVEKSNINIFEGLHTIDLLSDIIDLKVFMDIDINECIRRRIERDKKYGIDEYKVRTYFEEVIMPLYRYYIEPQKNKSDIVIEGDSDINCLLKKLVNY